MINENNDINRPSAAIVKALKRVGAATTSSQLARMGIQNSHISGPVSQVKTECLVGPALTLQCMPKREDVHDGGEYVAPELQLHRHVLYHTQPGDFVVVDARGNTKSGIFGEMMMTYFQGKGGIGVVVDGCLRDKPSFGDIDVGIWSLGYTPNFHTQTNLMPFAVNVPIACGDVFIRPGDLIVADEDGAVVVPIDMAEALIERASTHHEWEEFSKIRLQEGGELSRYYPLHDDAQPEYEEWKKQNGK